MFRQILETARMIIFLPINNLKCFRTAWREQKIVTADIVGDDRQHRTTPVRIENVSSRQINAVRVIDAPSRRKPLRFVRARERDQIRDLFAFEIDHPKRLAFRKLESGPGLGFYDFWHSDKTSQGTNGHFPECGNGAAHSSETSRPEYWRASDSSPNSLNIGLTSPWSAVSRSRIACCIRFQFP